MLAECKNSVARQTIPTEHVIIPDEIGLGVGGMFADIRNHAHKCNGEYVMVLSDDNVLIDENVAAEMKEFVERMHRPEVIIQRGDVCGMHLPAVWEDRPGIGTIDLSCYAVHHTVWTREKEAWGHRYEGDFDFIDHLWNEAYGFAWWDRYAYRALNIMSGRPE